MQLMGCHIRWPGFDRFTAAVAVGVLLWAAIVMSGVGSATPVGVGANLLGSVFGCVSVACGLDFTKGWRPLSLYVAGCAILLIAYHLVMSVVG